MTMHHPKFPAANEAAVEAAVNSMISLADMSLNFAERLAMLNIEAARTAVEESAAATRAVIGAKDATDAAAAQATLVQPAVEKATAYSRSLYDISNDAQQHMLKQFSSQFSEFQEAASALVAQAAKSAPVGSESILAAVRQAINNANSAFGNATAFTQQFGEQVANATQNAMVVASKTASAGSRKAK